MRSLTDSSIKISGTLLASFAFHRILSFPHLHFENEMPLIRQIDSFFVGLMSDIWISAIWLAFCIFLGSILNVINKRPDINVRILCFVGLAPIILVFMHQSYVEFFHVQILPQHLNYFGDSDFVEANFLSMFGRRALLLLFLSIAFGYLVFRIRPLETLSPKITTTALVVFFIISLGLHALNIRWRVNHFIPENLQTNLFEKLYLNFKLETLPIPPQQNLLAEVSASYGKTEINSFTGLIYWRPQNHPMQPAAVRMKSQIQKLRRSKKVYLISVVLESARPAEFGAYHQSNAPTLTPFFDSLSRQGILFERAYATGTVTRSAQEAIWCGYLSSMKHSLMRERQDLKISCLPSRTDDQIVSYFIHNGKASFDGQETFWLRQGVDKVVFEKSFPNELPRSGWGVSDLALFNKSLDLIDAFSQNPDGQVLLAQILTMTNHIPWSLPADASDTLKKASYSHPSYQTTAYTDEALRHFVSSLKELGIWNQTLLVISSDHGNLEQPYNDLYKNTPHGDASLQTHSVLLLSGGISETQRGSFLVENEIVSQASIGAFWSYLLEDNHPQFAQPLLSKSQRSPIFSDLGYSLFLPRHNLLIRRRDLLEKTFDTTSKEGAAVFYYRAFLHELNRISLRQNTNVSLGS